MIETYKTEKFKLPIFWATLASLLMVAAVISYSLWLNKSNYGFYYLYEKGQRTVSENGGSVEIIGNEK